MDPNFGFNSPAMGPSSKSGLSSARLLRRKKPTPATRPRPDWSTNDLGFNPLRTATETEPSSGRFGPNHSFLNGDAFGLGFSGRSDSGILGFDLENFMEKNEVADELGKLKIGNRAKFSKRSSQFERVPVFDLRHEIEELNIGGNVNIKSEVQTELEKLKIKDHAKDESKVSSEELKGLKIEKGTTLHHSAGETDVSLKETREGTKESGVDKVSGKNEESLDSLNKNLDQSQVDISGTEFRNAFYSCISSRAGLGGDRWKDQTATTSSSSFQSNDIHFPGLGSDFEAPFGDRDEEKVRANSISKQNYMGMEHLGFGALNLNGEFNWKGEVKREGAKGFRYKKRKSKARKAVPVPPSPVQEFACMENTQENVEMAEAYSPMDVSPYNTLMDEVASHQASVMSDQKIMNEEKESSMKSQFGASTGLGGEDLYGMRLAQVVGGVDIPGQTEEAETSHFYSKVVSAEGPLNEYVSDAESFKSAADHFEHTPDSFASAADACISDTEVTSTSIGKIDNDEGQDFGINSRFGFAPSAADQNPSLEKLSKHTSPLECFPFSGTSTQVHLGQGIKSDASVPSDQWKVKSEDISCGAASIAARELCEKWRLRGNQAYANGNLSEAENFYTEGMNTISDSEASRSCLRSLMLCYSNRAATRMSLGRIEEALEDCMKAISLDPNFLKVNLRAANCYLVLGDIENALLHFTRCSQSGPFDSPDRKLVEEASEGLKKAKKVSESIKQSAELLDRRTAADTESALSMIDEALMLSPYSKKLLEKKADALLMLQKYEDVIQLCEQYISASDSKSSGLVHLQRDPLFIPRCLLLISKAHFYMGKLENALDILKRHERLPLPNESGSMTLESLTSLAGTISELLRLKAAGNRAFQSGKHDEAVQHYTAAISLNADSRSFTAICFCNRGAAYQALNQIADALADCSLAIALDSNYLKPYSRRAALFEMIRDYKQAAQDLHYLVPLLTQKIEDSSSDRMKYINELKQAHLKLSLMEEAARKEVDLNVYLILGVDQSAAASDIKKAYRRAALKHHPDKAGQSLARSEGGDDVVWREIASGVYKDADRLFKMIGEAYGILSDPSKRAQYDYEEEFRKAANQASRNSVSKKAEDFRSYPYGRGKWEEGWKPNGRFRNWANGNRSYWYS